MGVDSSHLGRKLFSLRLNILVVTVGDNSMLGKWFHLYGANLRKLLLPTKCNSMGGSVRVMK